MTTAQRCKIEITGHHDSPVVVVLGGISSSRHVTATACNPLPGWWNDFVGPAKSVDTLRYRVVSMDYIDAPCADEPVSTFDQAAALLRGLDDNGIDEIHAVIGASYGGMVSLALGAFASTRIGRLIVISAAHESAPSAIANRSLQRQVVELGVKSGHEHDALVIARGMAMTTYSTPAGMTARFAANDVLERERKVEEFLLLAGAQFADRCRPGRFLALSRSLDAHRVDPSLITCDTTLVGVIEDALVPPTQLYELASTISGSCELNLISSIHGHDAFLEDQGQVAPIVERALSSRVVSGS